ncbi:MAG: HAD-IIIA family hydrolase [Candidatus Acidiferrum sp.]
MNEKLCRYVILDRDGVINRRHSSGQALGWDEFEFLPRSLEALRLLAANHYAVIVISRQLCASKGPQASAALDSITRRFLLEVALSGGHIAQVYYCRHQKEDGCNCHDPNSGLIARAKADHGFRLKETHFIGEREFDLETAAAAGCPRIRIQRDAFLQTQVRGQEPCTLASSLYDAAEQILALRQFREREYAALHGVEEIAGPDVIGPGWSAATFAEGADASRYLTPVRSSNLES